LIEGRIDQTGEEKRRFGFSGGGGVVTGFQWGRINFKNDLEPQNDEYREVSAERDDALSQAVF